MTGVPGLDSLLGNPLVVQLGGLGVLLLVASAAGVVSRRVLVRAIRTLVQRSQVGWDDAFVRAGVFARLAQVVPALVAWYGVQLVPGLDEAAEVVLRRLVVASLIVVTARAIAAALTALDDIYSANPETRRRPIKGYVQVAKIVLTLVAAILVVATLMDRSPVIFLSGLGAMTAVLLLVFRDTILSLVASVQLAGNDMIHVGDWIEMPDHGADGDVIDIALHTVKVQNWDKTITTIPTHKLIDESFKNWRGMSRSGGRRIKRAILIDVNTIRFLDDDEVQRFGAFALLRDYIEAKRGEVSAYNADGGRDATINADIRRLTNVGTFRAYVVAYLRSHPRVHQGMTLIVRQLAPTPQGLPLEIYCFTNITNWNAYEGIQSDIMDHLLAIAPEFGLRAFQMPSGDDVARLAGVGDARTS